MGVRREDLFRYDKIAERLTRVGWRPDGAREIERIVTSLAACEGVDAEVQWPDGTAARYRVAAAQPFPRVVVGRLEPGISRPTFEAIGSEYNILTSPFTSQAGEMGVPLGGATGSRFTLYITGRDASRRPRS